MLALLLSAAALAGPLTVDWEKTEPVKFHAEGRVQTPNGFLYVAMNREVRAMSVDIAGDFSCTGESRGKRGWKVICQVDDMKLAGRASPGVRDGQSKLDSLLDEGAELLRGAAVEMEIRTDGVIRTLDVEGIAGEDRNLSIKRNQVEQLRQLMRRVLSPIGVQMPKDAEGAKPWKHKGMPLFYEIMSMSGTAGGLLHKYTLDTSQGDLFVTGEGHGNLNVQGAASVAGSMGSDAAAGTTTTPAFNMVGTSQTRWDPTSMLPAYSEAAVNGTATASNMNLAGGSLYSYAGFVARVNADGSIEGLEAKK